MSIVSVLENKPPKLTKIA